MVCRESRILRTGGSLLLAPWFDGPPGLTIIQLGLSTQHHRNTACMIDNKNIFSYDGNNFQKGGETEGSEYKQARSVDLVNGLAE